MDRKEAILRIKDHMEHHGIGKYPHLKLKEALDMAIAALSQPNEWISVEDMLPEKGQIVLFHQKDGFIYCAEYFAGNSIMSTGWFIDNDCWEAEEVTHWMPLPAPPDRCPPEEEKL